MQYPLLKGAWTCSEVAFGDLIPRSRLAWIYRAGMLIRSAKYSLNFSRTLSPPIIPIAFSVPFLPFPLFGSRKFCRFSTMVCHNNTYPHFLTFLSPWGAGKCSSFLSNCCCTAARWHVATPLLGTGEGGSWMQGVSFSHCSLPSLGFLSWFYKKTLFETPSAFWFWSLVTNQLLEREEEV